VAILAQSSSLVECLARHLLSQLSLALYAPRPLRSMELFADALSDTQNQGVVVRVPAATKHVAFGQNLLDDEERIARDTHASVVDLDSDDECIEGAGSANEDDAWLPAKMEDRWREDEQQFLPARMEDRLREDDRDAFLPAVAKPKPAGARKRGKPQSANAHCSRKRRSATQANIMLTSVKEAATADVPCVFVKPEHGKFQIPIPLWDQHIVAWGTFDFEGARFLSVSPEEHWLMRLIDSQTKKPVRAVAKKFVDQFRNEFNAQVADARLPRACVDPLAEERDDDQKVRRWRSAEENTGLIEIEIAECKIICVNCMTRMLLKIDDATKDFIASVVVPVIKEVALSQDSSAVGDPAPSIAPAGVFQLGAKCTPNLREKVTWDVTKHGWLLHVKKPKGAHRARFPVDSLLDAAVYHTTKVTMYWAAVNEWNRCDGSTRFRIPVPVTKCTSGEVASQ
jgi:hypothetical protein